MFFKFLRHPKPYELESLENYIYRLSLENCCEVSWIWSELQLVNKTRISTINYENKDNILELIAKVTNNSINDIYRMTVHRFSNGLWHKDFVFRVSSNFKNIISIEYSKFCPMCLKESNYQRIFWLLTPITICIKHNTYLINKCIFCGDYITSYDVITGMCKCGHDLLSQEPLACMETLIQKSQKKIYEMFGISINNKIIKKSNLFNITYDLYIAFNNYIEIIFKKYEIDKSPVFIDYQNISNEFENYKIQIFTEHLFNNWPNCFIYFIDSFNENYYFKMNINIKKRYSDLISPIYLLLEIKKTIIKFDFLRNEVWIYFLKNYNIHFFKRILKPEIIFEKYISLDIAAKCFKISKKAIKENLNIKMFNNMEYIDIEEVLNVIKLFIKCGDIFKNELGYININSFSHKSLTNHTIFRISKLLLKEKIQIKIDIFQEGFCMVYVNENDLDKVIYGYNNC
jgi:hypothetical protein